MGSLTEASEDRGKRGRRTWKELWMTDESSLSSAAFIYRDIECVDLTFGPKYRESCSWIFHCVMLKRGWC